MKIDTSSIEGFEALSAEEKLAAVLGMDVPDPVDLSNYVAKATFDKKASEVAELSKKLKAKMTDDEQHALAQKEAQEAIQRSLEEANQRIAELTREKNISKLTADYIGQGYTAELAAKAAEALADGKTDKVLAYATEHMTAREQAIKAELLKSMPTPPGPDDPGKEDANIALAREFGKARAEGIKASNDVLANYITK